MNWARLKNRCASSLVFILSNVSLMIDIKKLSNTIICVRRYAMKVNEVSQDRSPADR